MILLLIVLDSLGSLQMARVTHAMAELGGQIGPIYMAAAVVFALRAVAAVLMTFAAVRRTNWFLVSASAWLLLVVTSHVYQVRFVTDWHDVLWHGSTTLSLWWLVRPDLPFVGVMLLAPVYVGLVGGFICYAREINQLKTTLLGKELPLAAARAFSRDNMLTLGVAGMTCWLLVWDRLIHAVTNPHSIGEARLANAIWVSILLVHIPLFLLLGSFLSFPLHMALSLRRRAVLFVVALAGGWLFWTGILVDPGNVREVSVVLAYLIASFVCGTSALQAAYALRQHHLRSSFANVALTLSSFSVVFAISWMSIYFE